MDSLSHLDLPVLEQPELDSGVRTRWACCLICSGEPTVLSTGLPDRHHLSARKRSARSSDRPARLERWILAATDAA